MICDYLRSFFFPNLQPSHLRGLLPSREHCCHMARQSVTRCGHIDMDNEEYEDGETADEVQHGQHFQVEERSTPPALPIVVPPIQESSDHLQRQQYGRQSEIGQTLHGVVLGKRAFLYRMRFSLEDARCIVLNHLKEFFRGWDVLFVFVRDEHPKDDEYKKDQPSQSHGIMQVNGIFEAKEFDTSMEVKTCQKQEDNK